jgi:hypothetical protein
VAYVAGALLGLAVFWVVACVLARLLKDVPLGPVNIWAKGEEYRKSERRNIEAQNRSYRFILRLWPATLGVLGAAVILLVIANR